jgi:glycerol-3-phosphate dehydrogenase
MIAPPPITTIATGLMNTSSKLDLRNRSSIFANLSAGEFDLLIIGGGITGAGIARDAAMRGLRVALVEGADFASGTSSRSSKLVHGGLRYLAQGDVGLVREAATERLHLRQIAPHLAQPIPFVVPAHSRAGIATLRTGMWTYEKLGKVPDSEKHKVWSRQDLEVEEPAVDSSPFAGAVVYSECITEDSRLTLANLRSASSHGAIVTNYARVTSIITRNARAIGVRVEDPLSGEACDVKAKVLVNAAGPWVDAIRQMEEVSEKNRLQLTVGIHVVVPATKLPLNRTLIIAAPDKRSIFAVPKDDYVYIGTTDSFYDTPDYWPAISSKDVNYLLDATNSILKSNQLTTADISASWSGIRPLVSQQGKSPSEISRKDEVWTGPGGILSIAGGKLTAYRRMAERIVDRIQELLGQKVSESNTLSSPLPGGEESVEVIKLQLGNMNLAPGKATRMTRLYGTEALAIASNGADVQAEVSHSVLLEGALTLEDYWVRRSARAWFNPPAETDALNIAANTMATLLNWSEQQKQEEIASCQHIDKDNMR